MHYAITRHAIPKGVDDRLVTVKDPVLLAYSEDELRAWVRARLRSSRVPSRVVFRRELPYNETGKLLRRVLRAELAEGTR
jgi:acyl-coenzyme A synthetase/AMP-(fatty) acid ligase